MTRRLDRWPRDAFSSVVVDEAHHAVADTYRNIFEHFSDARLLGVTATVDRGDKRQLGDTFDNIAYEYSLQTAIREGYLAPITACQIPLEIDLNGVHTRAGEYQLDELGGTLDAYLEQAAAEVAARIGERKTLVFTPLIATSERFVDCLRQQGVTARHIDGNSPDRREILANFTEGGFQVLSNASLLLEGYDEPSIGCIVPLRPTNNRSLYAQMVGRGTRIAPGKNDLLLLDFAWLALDSRAECNTYRPRGQHTRM